MSTGEGRQGKRSEFIGGETWHVGQPEPLVSECMQLIIDARNGDEYAIYRCQALYIYGKKIKPIKYDPGTDKTLQDR